jgi:large subunit ribosomal protein L9
MDVILLKDVPGVGKKYDVKKLPSGHVRNFLLPKGFAELATPQSLTRIEGLKNKLIKEREEHARLLSENLKSLKGVPVLIKAKANEEGHLFASVTKERIVEALKGIHIAVEAEHIQLKKPIKTTGEFDVEVRVKDKTSNFTLTVESESKPE